MLLSHGLEDLVVPLVLVRHDRLHLVFVQDHFLTLVFRRRGLAKPYQTLPWVLRQVGSPSIPLLWPTFGWPAHFHPLHFNLIKLFISYWTHHAVYGGYWVLPVNVCHPAHRKMQRLAVCHHKKVKSIAINSSSCQGRLSPCFISQYKYFKSIQPLTRSQCSCFSTHLIFIKVTFTGYYSSRSLNQLKFMYQSKHLGEMEVKSCNYLFYSLLL